MRSEGKPECGESQVNAPTHLNRIRLPRNKQKEQVRTKTPTSIVILKVHVEMQTICQIGMWIYINITNNDVLAY